MKRFVPRSKKAVIGLIVVALAIAGAAVAAWIITASGPGAAKVGALTAPTITADTASASSNAIYPGQVSPLYLTISNPNPVPLYLATAGNPIAFDAPVISGASGTCAASNFTFAPMYFSPSITVPVGSSSVAIPGVVTLNADAATGCMGASVQLTVDTATFSLSAS